MTKQIFKAGDIVKIWGFECVLEENPHCPLYKLRTKIDVYERTFTEEGKIEVWHKTPALELISRPEEIEEIKLTCWFNRSNGDIKFTDYSCTLAGNWEKIKPIFT